MLKFSDGMSFDTSGPLRVEHRSDGYYVVGNGRMFAVDTYEEGRKYIAEQNTKAAASAVSDR